MDKETLHSSRAQADWWRGDNCNFLVDRQTIISNNGKVNYD